MSAAALRQADAPAPLLQVQGLSKNFGGVRAVQGRGLHLLPSSATKAALATLVGSLEEAELRRAFRAAVELLLNETVHVDEALAQTLAGPLQALLS